MFLSVLIFSCSLFFFITFANYANKDVKVAFNYFKEKFNKVYKSKGEEEVAIRSFAKNKDLIETLNGNNTDKNMLYVMNEYADIDADNFEEMHAVTIVPYDIHYIRDSKKKKKKHEKHTLATERHEIKSVLPVDTFDEGLARYESLKVLEFVDVVSREEKKAPRIKTDLYDLTNAQNLYDDFMKKFHKKNATNEYDRYTRYMRFVKTLVELNRMKSEGKAATLNKDADIIKEPHNYFY